MEKIVKKYLYEKIKPLNEAGRSVYEIATMLKAHPILVLKTVRNRGSLMRLEKNNRNFFLKINSLFPSPDRAAAQFKRYNVITGPDGKMFFTGKFPRTFNKWKEQLPLTEQAKLEEKEKETSTEDTSLLQTTPTHETTGWLNDEDEDFPETGPGKRIWDKMPVKKEEEKAAEKNKEKDEEEETETHIIRDYLDGISLDAISFNHEVSDLYVLNLVDNYYLPETITLDMLAERVRGIVRSGASKQYIEWRFSHIPAERLSAMMLPDPKPKKIKTFVKEHMPEHENTVFKKKMKKISDETDSLIIEDYRGGMTPDEIAKKYEIGLKYVLPILYTSREYVYYHEKNVADEKERHAAIADYFKRGWSIKDLQVEFEIKAQKLKSVLEAKGFINNHDENSLPGKKRTKADLIVYYYKRKKSIFEIADLVLLTPERVEELLKKKGAIGIENL